MERIRAEQKRDSVEFLFFWGGAQWMQFERDARKERRIVYFGVIERRIVTSAVQPTAAAVSTWKERKKRNNKKNTNACTAAGAMNFPPLYRAKKSARD